jgi:hypothetical protein
VRYVVEADHPGFAGMLHIFNGDQWSLGPNLLSCNCFIVRTAQRPLMTLAV